VFALPVPHVNEVTNWAPLNAEQPHNSEGEDAHGVSRG
jgi:hypothetical protein